MYLLNRTRTLLSYTHSLMPLLLSKLPELRYTSVRIMTTDMNDEVW